ncbi:MAG: HAMP domain-containing sensor histidine kinase [Ilumatobacteraceae bacterium]
MGLLNRRRETDGASPELDDARAETDRLRLELDRARSTLDGLPIGVVVVDADGAVVSRNRSASFGRGHSEVLISEAIDRQVRQALDGRESTAAVELFGPPKRVVQVRATPQADGGAYVVVEDISERARLDAVRTDFVANISHELKTPVGALAVLAEALSEETDLAVVHRLAGKMVDEAHRAATSIDDLLELSRIELGGSAVRDPVDVRQALREAVIRSLAAAEQRDIRIDLDEPVEPITVLGDRRQLVSAISNLIDNAVKYSEPGSDVYVSTTREQSRDHVGGDAGARPRHRHPGQGPRPDLRALLPRRPGPQPRTGGTGLGLAIVRHVATNHEGDVQVTSIEGEGSTFTLRIPVAP